MTYSTGGLVQATDFNTFAGNINAVWNTKYGQTSVSTVSQGATVSAANWASLNSTIANTAAHQGTTITSRTGPVAGQTVAILPNLSTDIASCTSNTYNAASQGSQYTAWTGTASVTATTGTGTSPWTITFTDTVTFANATAASSFFNSGATVKIQFSKTSTGQTGDAEWNSFISTVCGTIYLSSTGASKTINGQTYTGTTKIGGTGNASVLNTTIGFAQLNSTPAVLYTQYDTGPSYSSNDVSVSAAYNGTTTLTLVTTWHSAANAAISGGTATTGISFGTAPTTVVTYFAPETTYLTNTWGTPTVASSVSVTNS
jgi:hypothetical protein